MMALILVVEDDAGIRAVLERALGDEGYGVLVAETGAAGLAVLVHTVPDLIVTDYTLPVMDGGVLCRQLADDATYAHIPRAYAAKNQSKYSFWVNCEEMHKTVYGTHA